MLHKEHLEEKYGVGPHTISVPRIKKARMLKLKSTLTPFRIVNLRDL